MLTEENEHRDEKQTQSSGGASNEFAECTQTVRSSQASYQEIFVATVRRRQFSAAISFAILRHRNDAERHIMFQTDTFVRVGRFPNWNPTNSPFYNLSFVPSLSTLQGFAFSLLTQGIPICSVMNRGFPKWDLRSPQRFRLETIRLCERNALRSTPPRTEGGCATQAEAHGAKGKRP
jgi:hypothetical protein